MRNHNEEQQSPLQAKWIGYAVTVAVEALLTIGLKTIEPHFPLSISPISYILVLMAAAYIFGEGPAILAFLIGLVLFTYFFVYPVHFFWPPANTPEGWARLTAFFIGAFIVGFSMLLIRRSKKRVEAAADRESEARKIIQSHFELLQRALLPKEPSVDHGYSAAARYISAYEGQEIGGDFYDVFQTEDGKVGVLIGDVSGKGIEAASLAAATRSTVRAFAYDLSSVGEAMTHANSVLSTQLPEIGSFVTVSLMILDLPSGDILYCSAGHPPAAVYRSDKSVEFLTFGQPPVGPLEKLEFKESRSHIAPGEKLVLYTDGILEARHGNEMFGAEGIENVLKEYGHLSSDEVADKMLSTARDWSKGRLTDDAAIIVIERNSVANRA